MSNTEKFDKMLSGMVNKERAADYGHPSFHFEISAGLKKIIRDHFDCEGDERLLHAMDMVCDKLARLCHTPTHFDSWLDIAGYARTAMMVMDRYAEPLEINKVEWAEPAFHHLTWLDCEAMMEEYILAHYIDWTDAALENACQIGVVDQSVVDYVMTLRAEAIFRGAVGSIVAAEQTSPPDEQESKPMESASRTTSHDPLDQRSFPSQEPYPKPKV